MTTEKAQAHRGSTGSAVTMERCKTALEMLAAATRCGCGATKPAGTVYEWRAVLTGDTFAAECPRCAGRERRG